MKTATITIAGLIALLGAGWTYAGEGVAAVGQDVAAVTIAQPTVLPTPPETTRIEPGVLVYAADGTRIGPVRAYTQRGEEVRTVWIGRTEYAPGSIVVRDGRAVLLDAG